MIAPFKRHRFLKVLAIVLVAGALAYTVGVIKPFVDARGIAFESCPVYYVSGRDFVRIVDSSSGIYSVGDYERENFSFAYDRGTYACSNGQETWKMRLTGEGNIYDLRSSVWLWGTEI